MICIVPANELALGTLPPQRLKNASGLYNLMRNLGGAVGLAVVNTVLSERLQLHWSRLVDAMDPTQPGVVSWLDEMSTRLGDGIAGDPALAARAVLARIVARESMVMSVSDCFLVVASGFACALCLLPLVRRARAVGGGH
jgi:DHA2 family multidrug resistance protein